MKRAVIIRAILLSAILLQLFLFLTDQWMGFYSFPFATDFEPNEAGFGDIMSLLIAYLPIPFISFVFWGRGYDLIRGHGKIIIVRNCNLRNLILKRMGLILGEWGLIFAVQVLLYAFFNPAFTEISFVSCFKALVFYYVGIAVLLLSQFYMELRGQYKWATVALNIYVVISLALGDMFYALSINAVYLIPFFPNFAFASRNGTNLHMTDTDPFADSILTGKSGDALTVSAIDHHSFDISPWIPAVTFLMMIILLFLLSIRKIKRSDIW